mmetsp:Transcript_1712/g.1848  ORF Transcript_1712/g.1848 Transcript_1712/m.1848 type:complete len:564 (-) Transcript_1712:199-1890(-)
MALSNPFHKSGRSQALSPSNGPSNQRLEAHPGQVNPYKNPNAVANSTSPLKINVSMTNNSDEEMKGGGDSLGEPFNLEPSPSISSSKINFDKITQLPTPIINNNNESFANFSPPKEQYLDIQKSRNVKNLDTGRVVSEYRPLPAGHQNLNIQSPSKRFVSNPLNDSSTSIGSIPVSNIPSPPDESQSRFTNHQFYSINRGKVYNFEDEIGTGNFSTVVLGSNVNDAEDKVAIKVISIPTDNIDEVYNFKFFIRRELNILHNLNHACIIHLLDYNLNLSIDKSEIESIHAIESENASEEDLFLQRDLNNLKSNNDQLVFLNYCPGGNLFQLLFDNYKINHTNFSYWLIIQRIVSEIIVATSYLHLNDIIHRDIKLENILLNYKYYELQDIRHFGNSFAYPLINVTDFGLSKKLKSSNELLTTRCGSQDYISPELLMGLKYDGKLTDSWSVGVLIYALLENRLPFDIPPFSASSPTGVSPSVIRRKRAKNNVAHRIAMIDWDWFRVTDMLNDSKIDNSTKQILLNLKHTVDLLLVRKDKRVKVEDLINHQNFDWISKSVPDNFIF